MRSSEIAEQNRYLLQQQRYFRIAADVVTNAWMRFAEVVAVAVIGSVAKPLWKEIPRFSEFRRARIEVWHECRDLDLALWLDSQHRLGALRKAAGVALRNAGRLCKFSQCPKGKRDCLVQTDLLLRLPNGDAHVAADLKRRICTSPQGSAPLRTAGDLSRRAQEIREAGEQADVLRREAEWLHQLAEAEKARRARLDALRHREESVWTQIEEEIERRNASAYDRAAALLADMQALALGNGSQSDFDSRLASIRARHEKKARFIERLRVFRSPLAMETLR